MSLLAGVCLLILATPAQATFFNFINITGNNPTDAAIGEAQLMVDITEVNPGHIQFTYMNIGPLYCSITDIYVEDQNKIFSKIDTIFNVPGLVEFSKNPKPGNLPGGKELSTPFKAVGALSLDSDPPTRHMGIDPGETLNIIYDLNNGLVLDNVINEISQNNLRIGIHVQGFESGGSESYVITHLPEPTSLALLTLGILMVQRCRSLKH